MKSQLSLALLVLCFSVFAMSHAGAGDARSGGVSMARVLRYSIPNEGFLDPESQQILDDAMKFIESAEIGGVKLVRAKPWEAYDFVIKISRLQMLAKDREGTLRSGQIISDRKESATYVFQSHPEGPFAVQLLWELVAAERLASGWKPRSDVPASVVTALVREIYGNVVPLMDKKWKLTKMASELEKKMAYVALLSTEQLVPQSSHLVAAKLLGELMTYVETTAAGPGAPSLDGLSEAMRIERERVGAGRAAGESESRARALAFFQHVQCRQMFAPIE